MNLLESLAQVLDGLFQVGHSHVDRPVVPLHGAWWALRVDARRVQPFVSHLLLGVNELIAAFAKPAAFALLAREPVVALCIPAVPAVVVDVRRAVGHLESVGAREPDVFFVRVLTVVICGSFHPLVIIVDHLGFVNIPLVESVCVT